MVQTADRIRVFEDGQPLDSRSTCSLRAPVSSGVGPRLPATAEASTAESAAPVVQMKDRCVAFVASCSRPAHVASGGSARFRPKNSCTS